MRSSSALPRYSRASFATGERLPRGPAARDGDLGSRFTRIGGGQVGGKAAGLLRLLDGLATAFPDGRFGCAAHPGDHDHRKMIFKLAGTPASRKGGLTTGRVTVRPKKSN